MTERKQRIEMKQTPVVANNTGYINKQALLDEFEKWNFGKHGQLEKYFADRVFSIIDKVPTADVVEVIYCKECKYFSEIQHCGVLGFCEPNEYCSRGERRKEDDKRKAD